MQTPVTTSPIQQASEDVRTLIGMSATIGTFPVNSAHRAIVRAHSDATLSRMLEQLERATERLGALRKIVQAEKDYRTTMEARSRQTELPV